MCIIHFNGSYNVCIYQQYVNLFYLVIFCIMMELLLDFIYLCKCCVSSKVSSFIISVFAPASHYTVLPDIG